MSDKPVLEKTADGVLLVKCPTCQKPVRWEAASAFRPFCSDRCRLIDLGAWASESYSIPVETPPDLDDFDQ